MNNILISLFLGSILIIFTSVLTAVAQQTVPNNNSGSSNPIVLIIVIIGLALAPFALIMMTSFVKIAVVLSIVRNALGTQQIPPNQVLTGISLILTIFIMTPVVEKMRDQAGEIKNTTAVFSEVSVLELFQASDRAKEPLRDFLNRYAKDSDKIMFMNLAKQLAVRNGNNPDLIVENEFRVLIPSFVTSQLTEAFQIGFFLLIPFLVVDMVVSNILQAMGMVMLSPVTISLPFKLLLFVSIDGWVLLTKGLVMGYT